MWMVDPSRMCVQHLRGEHLEIHMFIGSLRKQMNLAGYFQSDCLEPLALSSRHDAIVRELTQRGAMRKHLSFIDELELQNILAYLPRNYLTHKIDRVKSTCRLLTRCIRCWKRMEEVCAR
jgi:hypothetical protein